MISSQQSFGDFVAQSVNMLEMSAGVSDAQNLSTLYNLAAAYNPLNRPPKQALAGTSLYDSMIAYLQATVPHRIVMQTATTPWPDLTNAVDTLAQYYDARANNVDVPPNPWGDLLTQSYLHVGPPPAVVGDWRIGLNIVPEDIAPAVGALTPLLNRFPEIVEMKFLGPASIAKADAVILYLRYDMQRYAQLRQAVLTATAGLRRQARVGAMWNEIADGIGEAAESPMDGTSFTAYRVQIVYLAYTQYRLAATAPTYPDFLQYLTKVMALFGLDPANPHLQGPLLTGSPLFQNWWGAATLMRNTWTPGQL